MTDLEKWASRRSSKFRDLTQYPGVGWIRRDRKYKPLAQLIIEPLCRAGSIVAYKWNYHYPNGSSEGSEVALGKEFADLISVLLNQIQAITEPVS